MRIPQHATPHVDQENPVVVEIRQGFPDLHTMEVCGGKELPTTVMAQEPAQLRVHKTFTMSPGQDGVSPCVPEHTVVVVEVGALCSTTACPEVGRWEHVLMYW